MANLLNACLQLRLLSQQRLDLLRDVSSSWQLLAAVLQLLQVKFVHLQLAAQRNHLVLQARMLSTLQQ